MFVTLVHKNDQLAALVRFEEDHVDITARKGCVGEMLRNIYSNDMNPLEFARANYQLNKLRPKGITWELVLSTEFEKSCN